MNKHSGVGVSTTCAGLIIKYLGRPRDHANVGSAQAGVMPATITVDTACLTCVACHPRRQLGSSTWSRVSKAKGMLYNNTKQCGWNVRAREFYSKTSRVQ